MSKTNKTLPDGNFSKKGAIFTYIYVFGMIILGVVLLFILPICLKQNFFLCLIGYLVLLVVCFYLLTMQDDLNKVVRKFQKDANYHEFVTGIEELLTRPLSEETKNYVQIFYANYSFAYDIEQGIERFSLIQKPKSKLYQTTYEKVFVIFQINRKDYKKANELIYQYYNSHRLTDVVETTSRYIKVVTTTEEIKNIKDLYPIDTKNKFVNLQSADTLIAYYQKRDQKEEAKKYAKFILDSKTDLEEFNRDARLVLEEEKHE